MADTASFPPLTSEEEEQWKLFSCASRCIIALAIAYRIAVTRDEFVHRFREYFPPTKLGLLDTAEVVHVLDKLGLSKKIFALRNRVVVRTEIEKRIHRGVLLLTDRERGKDGQWGDFFHCRLSLGFASPGGEWLFWHPDQSGKAFEIAYTEEQLDDRLAHFLLVH